MVYVITFIHYYNNTYIHFLSIMLNQTDQIYFDMISKIVKQGTDHYDRTGTGTKRLFGEMFKFDLSKEFPAITCKPAPFKNTVRELLWFLKGDNNISKLKELGGTTYKWWEPFSQKDGTIGPMYNTQLTNFNNSSLNQIEYVINTIKNDPNSRRIVMTTYNPIQAPLGSLYVCHGVWSQFMVDNDNRLHMNTMSRSMDWGIGAPSNFVLYGLLQHMIANICNLKVGVLTYFVNDVHIYNNHMLPLLDMKQISYCTPQVKINRKVDNIFDYTLEDFKLLYNSGPKIKLPMSV